jgi:predicted amidohydrolase
MKRRVFASIFLSIVFASTASGNCGQQVKHQATPSTLRVAAVQYPMTRPASFAQWEAKLQSYFEQAHQGGADILLLPELASIEALALIDPAGANPASAIREMARHQTPRMLNLLAEWSERYRLTSIAGSWPVENENGDIQNVAYVYNPDRTLLARQVKNHLTQWEKDSYRLTSGTGNAVSMRLPSGVEIAVAICFDSEFPDYLPLYQGVIPEVIFVPSMTEDDFGRFRVSRSASARAVENHAYVVVTGTVGGNASDAVLGAHSGQAKVFTPSDRRFPADGLLAEGNLNQPSISYFNLDLDTLRQSRETSTTFPLKQLHPEYRR